MKKAFFVLPSLLAAASLTLVSCKQNSGEAAIKTGAQPTVITVKGIVVQSQPLDNIVRSTGTVLASESVDLVAEVAGRVEAIPFKEGVHVTKGDLLVKINDDDLQAQLKKTELQIQLTAEQESRQKQLYDMGGISKEQYDISLNQLNSYRADRENLIASIRKREIRAPFDGRIGLRYVSEGSYVSPATRIASMQKINPLKVDFSIPEKYAGQVNIGDAVKFSNDETQLQLTGTVYAMEPRIDAATRTLQIRALCNNKAERVFPGAYVQIELRLKQIQNALMVPTQSIIPVQKGQTVLVRKNGVTVSVPVKTGVRTASEVQILDGIAEGDTVITTGLMQLRPGMPVNVAVNE